jgi:protein TonB
MLQGGLADLTGPGAGGSSSPLVWALGVSVALHAALIAGLPDLATYSPTPATAPLHARIEPGAPAGESPVPVSDPLPRRTPPAAVTPPQKRAPEAQPPQSRRSAAVARAPVAPPDPRLDIVDAPAEPRPAPPVAVSATAPGVSGAGGGSGEPTLAPRAGDEALDYGSLAQYRLALIGTAKRHRLYPAYAIERGWHGRVEVRLSIGADGGLAAAQIRSSSGHQVLDGQALEMLRKASELTPLPPALRDREFTVDVPVVFELLAER